MFLLPDAVLLVFVRLLEDLGYVAGVLANAALEVLLDGKGAVHVLKALVIPGVQVLGRQRA